MEIIESGSQLMSWRKANNIERKDFAEMVNYSYDRIAKIENQNLPVPQKILIKVVMINDSLHPAMEQISIKWDKLKEYHTFFDEEIDLIEKNLLELLSVNVNKLGLAGTTAYLKFIGLSLGDLKSIVSSDFTDNEHNRKEMHKYLDHINMEAEIYLNTKYHIL